MTSETANKSEPYGDSSMTENRTSTGARKISLTQACGFVGVGEETLIRFMESGYFPGSSKESGINVADLEAIFGVRIPAPFIKDRNAEVLRSNIPEQAPKAKDDAVSNSAENLESEIAPDDIVASQTDSSAQPAPEAHSVTETVTESSSSGFQEQQQDAPFSSVPRRSLIEMYERLFSQLEAELKSVKNERDWLKTRIERYEEKSARDQLLMLAETQTIKSLIATHRPEKSPMRAALEWFGLLPPPSTSENPQSPDEVQRSEESKSSNSNKNN